MALKNVTGTIRYKDANGKEHEIDSDDLDLQEVERENRQQGDEIMYATEIEKDGKTITVEVWEYPLGSYNHHDISLTEYDGDFNFEFEIE